MEVNTPKPKILSIPIKQRDTPESIIMRYVIKNLGMNISISHKEFSPANKTYTYDLKATIPNEITPLGKSKRLFHYIFENLGKISVDENGLVTSESASTIENRIFQKFWSTQSKVDDIIKEFGKGEWGRLLYVSWFLHPLYTLLNTIQIQSSLNIEQMIKEDLWKYTPPLFQNDIIQRDSSNDKIIIPHHNLDVLLERENNNIRRTTEIVVGMLICNSFDYIRNELNITSINRYFEITKMYYIDAFNYGELINIPYKEFISKYHRFGRNFRDLRKTMNIEHLISDLIASNFILQNKSDYSITGNQNLFNKIMEHSGEILEGPEITIMER